MATFDTTCKKCGQKKINAFIEYCQECDSLENRNEFNQIREYLKRNPNSNAMDISKATKIPIERISQLIQQGALKTSN